MTRRVAVWMAIGILFMAAVVAAAATAGAGGSDSTELGSGRSYTTTELESGSGAKVAVVSVTGTIVNGTGGEGEIGEDDIVPLLEDLPGEGVDGVILEVNSPGGGVIGSDEISDAVQELSDDGTPVVAWMRDVAASGGYYVSAKADRIVAHPDTITGSIGVIIHLTNLEGLAKKVGVEEVVIKSGKLKDMGSPFRDLTAEERAVFKNLIDSAYARFVKTVDEGRDDLDLAEVKKLADGRIYTGDQAHKLGLVDELGGRDAAYEAMAELTDQESADDLQVVQYEPELSFSEILFGATAGLRPPTVGSVTRDLREVSGASVEYRMTL